MDGVVQSPVFRVLSFPAAGDLADAYSVPCGLLFPRVLRWVALLPSHSHGGEWQPRKPDVGKADQQPCEVRHNRSVFADGRSLERVGAQPKRNAVTWEHAQCSLDVVLARFSRAMYVLVNGSDMNLVRDRFCRLRAAAATSWLMFPHGHAPSDTLLGSSNKM